MKPAASDRAVAQAALDAIKPLLKVKTVGAQTVSNNEAFANRYLEDAAEI